MFHRPQKADARLPARIAERLLSVVYGTAMSIPSASDRRYEFSVHPGRVGAGSTHQLVWEVEAVSTSSLTPAFEWPNKFSQHIGDKAYGLLLAHLVGANVPLTRVLARKVAPFDFGDSTSTGEWWLRTAPAKQTPGHFTTEARWVDPFALLAHEDPQGVVASVLSQEAVAAKFSGATAVRDDGVHHVEGVAGAGDAFMLGLATPIELPATVVRDVRHAVEGLGEVFGPVRIEWAHDGQVVWVLQLHAARIGVSQGIMNSGAAESWIEFDPHDGLELLRKLILEAKGASAGILVTRPVGVTSHIGDLIRQAGIPGRVVTASERP
jgi:hypothetical protein